MIRVIGNPVQEAGLLIEITTETAPLRDALIDYGLRILVLSALISAVTAILLFLAVRSLLVLPIRRVVNHMTAYADAPEDARRIIEPTSRVVELREAEEALQAHADPADRRAAPEGAAGAAGRRGREDQPRPAQHPDHGTAFRRPDRGQRRPGRRPRRARSWRRRSAGPWRCANRRWPSAGPRSRRRSLSRFPLRMLADEVAEGEGLGPEGMVSCLIDVPPGLMVRADDEQLYRVLSNLIRNARQAIEATGGPGTIEIGGGEDDPDWWIKVGDTGPGLPPKAREHLFTAFQGGARKGGTGLGLAISAELVRGHGGRLELVRSDAEGTEFVIRLPKTIGPAERTSARRLTRFSPLHCRTAGAKSRPQCGPVAQLDRASDYESEGRAFESLRVRQYSLKSLSNLA